MEKYERQIGLKTIWLTIVRKWHYILFIFLPIVLVSYIVTNFGITKTYQASITLNRGAVISAAQYQVIQSYVTDTSTDTEKPGAIVKTALDLKEAGKKHSSGAEITAAEIKSGLSFTSLASNSIYTTFSFTSSDQSIIKDVLTVLADNSITYLKDSARNPSSYKDYANLTANAATNPSKNSSERKYFLIAVAAAFVLACGVPFVYEIIDDQVYDVKDLNNLGIDGFLLDTKLPNKNKQGGNLDATI